MTFQFDRGVVASTAYDSDGFLTVQVDLYGDAPNAGAPFGELQLPYGEYGRPCDPEIDADGVPKPSAACQALYWWDGPRQHVMPMQDPRIIPNLPKLSPGSKVWYAAGKASNYKPTFLHFDAATGDAVLYVPSADGSKAHVLSLSMSGDNITVRHSSGSGVSFTSTSAVINGPDGSTYLELKSAGAAVLNGNLQVTGSLGVQGMISQGPAPTQPALLATFLPSTQVLVSG